MTIGERIRERRKELGLTQDEVSKKLGYKSRSSVNKMELSRDLPLKKVEEMAKALDVTPAYLMGWEDSIDFLSDDNYFIETQKPTRLNPLYSNFLVKFLSLNDEGRKKTLEYMDDLFDKYQINNDKED